MTHQMNLHTLFAKPERRSGRQSDSRFDSEHNTPDPESADPSSSERQSSDESDYSRANGAANIPSLEAKKRSRVNTVDKARNPETVKTETHLMPGTVLTSNRDKQYTIGRKLSGMTGNYLAESNGERYVIKTGLDCSRRTAQRLAEREIHALTILKHEEVMPTLCDTGEAYARIFLVLPYIDGEDLTATIDRIGAFPNTSATDYLTPFITATGKIHRNGLIHRDLKPSNFRYHKTDECLDTEKPVILDGGLMLPEEEAALCENPCGSPFYASPEQTIDGYADKRSDVYSLGATLCEMLIGANTFSRMRSEHIIARDFNALDALAHDPNVDKHLSRVVQTATQPDPGKRYQNTNEMLEDLNLEDTLQLAMNGYERR